MKITNEVLTLERIEDFLKKKSNITIEQKIFLRDKKNYCIHSKTFDKVLAFNFDKRIIVGDVSLGLTRPIGYNDCLNN